MSCNRFLRLIPLAIVLQLCHFAHATISYVNGFKSDTTSTVTTLSITYSPTAGNTVVLFLNTSGGVTAVTSKDSSNNALTSITSASNTSNQYAFYYVAPSGITSFSASWTTGAEASLVVVEYSPTAGGSIVVSTSNFVTATGSASHPTASLTTDGPNDFIVCGFGDGSTSMPANGTGSVGNQREEVTASTARLTVSDNSSASAGSVSCGANSAVSATWTAIVVELQFEVSGNAVYLPQLGVGGGPKIFALVASGGNTSGSSTCVITAFPAVAGDSLVLGAHSAGAATLTVSDGQSNIFTPSPLGTVTNNSDSSAIWAAFSAASTGGDQITFSTTNSGGTFDCFAFLFSGGATAFDQSAAAANTSVTAFTSGASGTRVMAHEIMVGLAATQNGSNTNPYWAAGTNIVWVDPEIQVRSTMEYFLPTAVGTDAATATANTSSSGSMLLATLQ